MAAQVLVASTATPPHGWKPQGALGVGSARTFFTPGTLSAALASRRLMRPPTTGGLAMTAISMPGSVTSAPNCAAPVTKDWASIDGAERPNQGCAASGSRVTASSAGTGSFPAASASSPKLSFAPVRVLTTKCAFASQALTGTSQRSAAAVSSITRAVAAKRRSQSSFPRMLLEPSVFWSP